MVASDIKVGDLALISRPAGLHLVLKTSPDLIAVVAVDDLRVEGQSFAISPEVIVATWRPIKENIGALPEREQPLSLTRPVSIVPAPVVVPDEPADVVVSVIRQRMLNAPKDWRQSYGLAIHGAKRGEPTERIYIAEESEHTNRHDAGSNLIVRLPRSLVGRFIGVTDGAYEVDAVPTRVFGFEEDTVADAERLDAIRREDDRAAGRRLTPEERRATLLEARRIRELGE